MSDYQAPTGHDRPAWTATFFARVQRYRNLLFRRWWILPITLAAAAAVEFTAIKFSPPEFTSVGQMIVSIKLNIQQGSLYTEELGNFLGTQAALMGGNEVLNRARNKIAAQNPTAATERVALQVSVLPKTTIFVLRASGKDPDYTKAYLQACMEEYISLKKEMAEHTSDTTIAGLTDQILRLEPEMRKIDDQISLFLGTNDVALLEEASGVENYLTVLYQQLATDQSQRDLLNSMSLDQNLLLEDDRSALSLGMAQSPMIGGNPLLASTTMGNGSTLFAPSTVGMQYLGIKQQISLLKADQERFAEYLKPKHPKLLSMDQEQDRLGRLLAIYREQSIEQLEAKKSALDLQITNLQNQIKQWGKQNIELSRKSAEYDRLKAKSDRIQSLYDQLLATLQTLDVNKDISPESVTVYQPASDAFPDTELVKKLLIASVLGLILGLVILFLIDRVDDRMNSFTEFQELFDEEILGQIPRERNPTKSGILPFVHAEDERHPFVEAYRSLRSSLLYTAEINKRPHTLLITSSIPGDGKSVTTANLAITLAMGGSRVLLVDADLRKGSLHTRFNIQADTGLSEVLSQNIDWHPAVKETGVANLSLLPRGKTTQRSSEFFLGQVMDKFLKDANKEYDYVLIDTAPVMAADDVTSLAPRVDGVIFVIRAEHTSARVARAALEMLYQRKANILGVVLNSVRATSGDYYYYYHYKDYHKA